MDRLIIESNVAQDAVMICSEIEVEGVCGCHGSKENCISRDLIFHARRQLQKL